MRNKRIWVLLGMIMLVLATGCGKDDEKISDNTISGDNNINQNILSDNASGDMSGNLTGSISDNITEDISGNVIGSMSDNMSEDVSGNLTGSVGDNTQDALPDYTPGEIIGSLSTGRTNNIFIANMSGKDIETLTFTFSTDTGERDILGEEELKDGNMFVYSAADISSLQQMSGLRLRITATADDETVMEFPEIRVINIAGSTIVLSRGQSTSDNQAGYEAYIQ